MIKPGQRRGKRRQPPRGQLAPSSSRGTLYEMNLCWSTKSQISLVINKLKTNKQTQQPQSFIDVKTVPKWGRPVTLGLQTRTWVRRDGGGDETGRKHGSLTPPKRGLTPSRSRLSECTWHPHGYYVCIPVNQELRRGRTGWVCGIGIGASRKGHRPGSQVSAFPP